MRRWLLVLAGCVLAGSVLAAPIVLKEHLGKAWEAEVLTYPFTAPAAARCLPGSLQVTAAEGRVPAQLTDIACWPGTPYVKSATLALVSGLAPLQVRTFQVATGPKAAPALRTDLAVTPGTDTVEIVTARFGLRLLLGEQTYPAPQPAAVVPGPVAGLRLPDGRWFGGSLLYGARKIKAYRAALLDNGPALATWRARYTYEDDSTAEITIRLGAGLARAQWESNCSANDLDNGWKLNISTGLEPLSLVWRPEYQHNKWGTFAIEHGRPNGWGDAPKDVALAPDPAGDLTKLTPWNDWWDGTTQTGWAFKEGKTPVFIVRRADAGAWCAPAAPGTWANSLGWYLKMPVLVKEENGDINIRFNNGQGLRRWLLGSGVLGVGEQAVPATAGTADFDPPLNVVKDYVLEWPEKTGYPHIFLTKTELRQVWQRADPAAVEAFIKANVGSNTTPNPLAPWVGEAAIAAWLMSGTPEMARRMQVVEQGRFWLGQLGEYHWNMPMMIISLYDAVMGSDQVTPADAALFRAEMAYLGYALADPTTWCIERGYCSGNQDMSVARILSKGMAACAIPEHPQAKTWAVDANRMMEKWLAETGPGGEWPESASGYTIASISPMLTYAVAAERAGIADYLNDPRMKRMVLCMAKQFSPPDPRTGGGALCAMKPGQSHIPPVGDAIAFSTVITGLMARGIGAKDPDYAANLQWVWQRSGKALEIGSWRMCGFDRVCADPAQPGKTPDWTLDIFPRLGAIARAGLDSGKEDFLYLVTSDALNAMPCESGSITAFFSKGVPLVSSFLGRYTWRQTHLANRVCLAIKNPGYQANQLIAWHSGAPQGIWGDTPHGLFDERVGPSTTTAAADLPWQAYLQADFTLRGELKTPPSEKIADLPDWPEMEDHRYGRLPLDWRRQLLLLTDDIPGGMHYLVVRDTVKGGATRWQMWSTSEKIGTPDEVADRAAFLADKPGPVIVPARELPVSDRYTAVGRFGVDLDYYIAAPTDTLRHTLRWGTKYYQYNTLADYPDFQDLLHLQMPGDGAYFVALVPRTAGDPAPVFATLGDGTIIKVTGAFGTDYAFLSAQPIDAAGDTAAFHGTAAAIQDRKGVLVLSLDAPGSVRYGAYTLAADAPAALRVENATLTLTPAKGRATRATLTLPGPLKITEPVNGATLTKIPGGYQVHIDAGGKAVQLRPSSAPVANAR